MDHHYIVIPEYVVQDAADAIPEDQENSFARLLRTAAVFKEAGLTPIFMLDQNFKDMIVICKETFGKKLH